MTKRVNLNINTRKICKFADFFANLPDPQQAGESKTSTYMRRLKMIQDRSGLDNKY